MAKRDERKGTAAPAPQAPLMNCGSLRKVGLTMSIEQNKEVIRRLGELVNAGRLDELVVVPAPDYVRHDPTALLKDAGRAEYKQAFTKLGSSSSHR